MDTSKAKNYIKELSQLVKIGDSKKAIVCADEAIASGKDVAAAYMFKGLSVDDNKEKILKDLVEVYHTILN